MKLWGVLLAAAFLLGAGPQQPNKQAETAGTTAKKQASPQNSASPAPTAQSSYRPYPERYSDACYDAQDHEAADLCAQWRAAIAAEKAAREARIATIAAIIGTVLSLATVIGLIITICQTSGALGEARRGNRLNVAFERRARRESREAAAAQERALAIAERQAEAAEGNADQARELSKIGQETALKQLRAYVSVIPGPLEFRQLSDGTYVFLARNFLLDGGQTPAYSCAFLGSVRIGSLDRAKMLADIGGTVVEGGGGIRFVVPPHGRRPAELESHLGWPVENIISAADGTGGPMVMVGTCEYTDSFKISRKTNVCLYGKPILSADEIANREVTAAPHDIIWLTAAFHNDAT